METPTVLVKEQLKDLWLEKAWEPDETFHLYIHNPFCLTECTFCKHQGMRTKVGSEIYERYYREYLPGLITFFGEVIRSQPPKSIYFGGGTSSMMTSEIMVDIFEAVPNFRSIPFKTFECNPSLMTERKIELLSAYGFTYVSFGVQTFNERILVANDRPPIAFEKLKRLAMQVQGHGMVLNCDLITFIDKKTRTDLRQLESDLNVLASDLRPDVITVYPETFVLRALSDPERLQMVGCLQLTLSRFESRWNGAYHIARRNKDTFFSVEAIRSYLTKNYRIL